MKELKGKGSRAARQLLRLLPLLCMAGVVLWAVFRGGEFSVEAFLQYAPEDRVQAALFLWLAFAVKSLSLMLPVMLLFAVSGLLFPLPVALLINLVGIFITLSLPYGVGRFSGPDLTGRLMKKHPRLSELRTFRSRNNFFFSFIVRAVGVLPCDIVSLYMGNTRMPYAPYIAGGVLGFLPDLICATILGMQITHTDSPWFWVIVAVNLLFCLGSALLYRFTRRRSERKAGQRPPEQADE